MLVVSHDETTQLTKYLAMIKFVLMVNKQGQTRLASYFQWYPIQERVALEAEVQNAHDRRHFFVCYISLRGWFRSFEGACRGRSSSVPSSNTADLKLYTGDMPPCSSWWLWTATRKTNCQFWSSFTALWRPWTNTLKVSVNWM